MKYVSIYPSDTLVSLSERVGYQNVDQILADNGLSRSPSVGKAWKSKCDEIIANSEPVEPQRKITVLNTMLSNSDVYETAALADENTWKVLSAQNAFPNYLYLSDQMEDAVPDSQLVLGNKQSVRQSVREAVNSSLATSGVIDTSIFSTFSTILPNDTDIFGLTQDGSNADTTASPFNSFAIPNGDVVLYSSISGDGISIPAYPEEVNDSRTANYTQMPDLIYQYEPWQIYQSSGPRSNTYEFHLHRDMWTGDHSDGKANELIRFCEAQCYPQYEGAAVRTSTITLYVAGSELVTGVMTAVHVNWTGPLGLDGWYLEFTLSLEITEVSSSALNYDAILNKPLIG